jgi:hypothetical protein
VADRRIGVAVAVKTTVSKAEKDLRIAASKWKWWLRQIEKEMDSPGMQALFGPFRKKERDADGNDIRRKLFRDDGKDA